MSDDYQRDVILYNLGVGATSDELQWTYEGDEEFSALPTFGVVPQFFSSGAFPLDWLPNYNPVCSNVLGVVPASNSLELRQSFFTESSSSRSRRLFPPVVSSSLLPGKPTVLPVVRGHSLTESPTHTQASRSAGQGQGCRSDLDQRNQGQAHRPAHLREPIHALHPWGRWLRRQARRNW